MVIETPFLSIHIIGIRNLSQHLNAFELLASWDSTTIGATNTPYQTVNCEPQHAAQSVKFPNEWYLR